MWKMQKGRVLSLRLTLVVLAMAAGTAHGQVPAEFAVASVKAIEGALTTAQMNGYIEHGRAVLNNARLIQIIATAYNIQGSRIERVPHSLDFEQYQIVAQAEDATTSEEQVKVMLQALLADRFKLRIHKESRLLPNYTLLMAKNGPKIGDSKDTGEGKCSFSIDPPAHELICTKSPIIGLANAFSNLLRAPVVDQTGLAGAYDFTIRWEGDDSESGVFDAVEKLGLKLEMKKSPTDVLVVDSVEKPSEN